MPYQSKGRVVELFHGSGGVGVGWLQWVVFMEKH